MSYQIVTDSCCDFTEEVYSQLRVSYAPLTVTYNGKVRQNFSDEKALSDFYEEIRQGATASTAAANPQDWKERMQPILEGGEDVLALCFSSGLSTTYQSAVIAAQELEEAYPQRKIRVVDSLCAALGQGFLLWHACGKRDEGMPLDELAQWLEEHRLHVCHWFTVDDLHHLRRGGRISSATAIMGSMLNVKPILHVDNEGKLINVAKVRGRKAALEYLAKKLRSTATDMETAFITHGDCLEEAQELEKLLKADDGVKNVRIGCLGPVIGAHTGPGVLAVCFWGTQR